jgi:DNA-binding response OmpR family regulator
MPFVSHFHILNLENTQMLKKILIVEDNSDLVEILQNILKHFGYAPIVAMTGKQGVNLATSHLPDLVLLDISLPDMDGFTVACQIRQNQKTHSIPILATTGKVSFEDRERCLKNGCDDYISKPYTPKELASHIEKLLL